jgi:hypothetical protein
MSAKSAQKSVPGKPFQEGKDSRRGRGPQKGAPNAGRPTEEFKAWLEGLMDQPEKRQVFEAYLAAGNMKAWEFAAKYTKSMPAQQHNVNARVEFVKARETRRK